MIFNSLSSEYQFWVAGLVIIWAVLLFGGFLFGRDVARRRRMPTWTRLLSTAVLVLLAWSLYGLLRDSSWSRVALLFALGISLGFAGDIFMAGLLLPAPGAVMGGMGAFGLGHILYILAIFALRGLLGLETAVSFWLGWLLWLLIGVAGWYFVVFRGRQATLLHKLALPYALLLASTAGFATGLTLNQLSWLPLALGAALFLISDLIIAADLFNEWYFPYIGDLIWLIYGPGQLLIITALLWQ